MNVSYDYIIRYFGVFLRPDMAHLIPGDDLIIYEVEPNKEIKQLIQDEMNRGAIDCSFTPCYDYHQSSQALPFIHHYIMAIVYDQPSQTLRFICKSEFDSPQLNITVTATFRYRAAEGESGKTKVYKDRITVLNT